MTENELNSLITRRRAISGESYEKARQAVLEYLKAERRISEEDYRRLKAARGGH